MHETHCTTNNSDCEEHVSRQLLAFVCVQMTQALPVHVFAEEEWLPCCRKLVDKMGTVSKKDIEEVHDVAQLQVIIHLHKDQDTTLYGTGSQLCYHIMGLVHTKWAPIPGSIKDYIATPKTNGYQASLAI